MSKMLYWAINPNHKPSTSELREAIISGGESNRRRLATYDRYPEKTNSVGVLPVSGSLYTSDYKRISAIIEAFNTDPEVSVILMDIDSPGGLVAGSMETASVIASSEKPVYAYIEGMGCSAAYLLASAAKKIYSSPASESGSIGVQASWTNFDGLLAKLGIQKVYFRSKHSDKKNLSPASKEGEEAIQKTLDEIWELFAASIASYRGVEVAEIIEKFGQGEVFLGEEAKERGLIDEIVNNFEACVKILGSANPQAGEGEEIMRFETVEQLTAEYPELVGQIVASASEEATTASVAEERERVSALLNLRKHTEDFSLIETAITDGKDVAGAMGDILDAETAKKEKAKEEAKTALEEAAKDSKKAVVVAAPLADDGNVTDEEKAKARIEEINKNLKESK